MADFPAAPTYADVILVDPLSGRASFNPIWLKWFLELTAFVSASGGAGGGTSHEALTGMQGGGTGEHYHFTNAEHTALAAGFTGAGKLVRENAPIISDPTTAGTGLLHKTNQALTNGAAAALGTLANAPAAGNPTKWVPVDDNGTTRYAPLW